MRRKIYRLGTCACGSEGMTGQGSVVDITTLFKHTVVRCGHCCAHYEFPACCEPCAQVEPWEATG